MCKTDSRSFCVISDELIGAVGDLKRRLLIHGYANTMTPIAIAARR
jgi:hypothetical protein